MFYTLDIGNTNQTLIKHNSLQCFNDSFNQLDSVNIDEDIPILLSSVNDEKIPNKKKLLRPRSYITNSSLIDMNINYEETLGEDRLISAFYLFGKDDKLKLHIDSGSFTTIDLIDNSGFQGGVILPGIEKICETYSSGKNLHRPSPPPSFSYHTPQKTDDALKMGATLSILSPIIKILEYTKPDDIYISGGNAGFIQNLLSSVGFTNTIKSTQLVHRGLYKLAQRILI